MVPKGQVGQAVLVVDGQKLICNLITKSRFCEKPTYANLPLTLASLRPQSVELGVHGVAMPTIGCGLD